MPTWKVTGALNGRSRWPPDNAWHWKLNNRCLRKEQLLVAYCTVNSVHISRLTKVHFLKTQPHSGSLSDMWRNSSESVMVSIDWCIYALLCVCCTLTDARQAQRPMRLSASLIFDFFCHVCIHSYRHYVRMPFHSFKGVWLGRWILNNIRYYAMKQCIILFVIKVYRLDRLAYVLYWTAVQWNFGLAREWLENYTVWVSVCNPDSPPWNPEFLPLGWSWIRLCLVKNRWFL